jgi:hypothetical protein
MAVHVLLCVVVRYVGIFSALFAMSRSLVPGMEDYMCDHEQTMHKISAHTHYFPPHWKGKCHTYDVRQEFLQVGWVSGHHQSSQVFLRRGPGLRDCGSYP